MDTKPPFDDWIGRRLRDAEVTPSADVWQRLQERQQPRQARPMWYRWGASAAACLLLLGIGWWLTDSPDKQATVATHSAPISPNVVDTQPPLNVPNVVEQSRFMERQRSNTAQRLNVVATALKTKKQPQRAQTPTLVPVTTSDNNVVATLEPVPQPTDNVAASHPAPAERVLIVTIEQPTTLTAATKQAENWAAAPNEEAALSVPEKPQKTRVGKLFRQIKRLKQGEVLALRNDERSLLGRAYDEVRQNLTPEKPSK